MHGRFFRACRARRRKTDGGVRACRAAVILRWYRAFVRMGVALSGAIC